MNHPHDNTCALCHAKLSALNVQTCTRCGKKICGHHAHLLRNPHSYVLSSVCVHCTEGMVMVPYAHIVSSAQQQRQLPHH
jgi:dissimilatory sulfite reductase (desulfoviridin) alpha/beta subunit